MTYTVHRPKHFKVILEWDIEADVDAEPFNPDFVYTRGSDE